MRRRLVPRQRRGAASADRFGNAFVALGGACVVGPRRREPEQGCCGAAADLQLIDCALELVDLALQIGRLQLVLVQPRGRPVKLPRQPEAEWEGMPQRRAGWLRWGPLGEAEATGLLRRADGCAGMCLARACAWRGHVLGTGMQT